MSSFDAAGYGLQRRLQSRMPSPNQSPYRPDLMVDNVLVLVWVLVHEFDTGCSVDEFR